MIKILEVQFNLLKTKDLVTLECDSCHREYTKTKGQCVCNMIRKGVRCFGNKTYCSKECISKAYTLPQQFNICKCCGKATTNKLFCSKSCAAIVNNKTVPKRICKARYCRKCNLLVEQRYRKYCNNCIALGYNMSENGILDNQTLRQTIGKYDKSTNKFNSIRGHARRVYKKVDSKCQVCGYTAHVEVCHIKAVTDFSLDSLVSEINAPTNIALLCPNHHWELDRGILKLNN